MAEDASKVGSFEEYVVARWARLVRTAILMGVDPHTAEDATQTALARCFMSWNKVVKADRPDAYVHRILINTLNETKRKRSWAERPTDLIPDVGRPDAADDIAQSRSLVAALLTLPQLQRQAVVLRYYADLSEADTATTLGVAVGTVKSRTSRGLAALAAHPDLSLER